MIVQVIAEAREQGYNFLLPPLIDVLGKDHCHDSSISNGDEGNETISPRDQPCIPANHRAGSKIVTFYRTFSYLSWQYYLQYTFDQPQPCWKRISFFVLNLVWKNGSCFKGVNTMQSPHRSWGSLQVLSLGTWAYPSALVALRGWTCTAESCSPPSAHQWIPSGTTAIARETDTAKGENRDR